MITTCYMCDQLATSREHVPPKCFFPEKKDLPQGWDWRTNLISVPSCDEHNLSKSADDEYLLLVILVYNSNNIAALNQFRTKTMRMLEKRPHLASLFKNLTPVLVDEQLAMQFSLDMPRFDNAIDHIVRGLAFHHYQKKWAEQIHIYSPSILQIDQNGQYMSIPPIEKLNQLMAEQFNGKPEYGENSPIFYYQIHYHQSETVL